MPRIEDRTVADQVHELLAPEQPEDCRRANLEILARSLLSTGPVVFGRQVVSGTHDDGEWGVHFEPREIPVPPPLVTVDEDGATHETPAPEPADDDLATLWGLPAAAATPLRTSPPVS